MLEINQIFGDYQVIKDLGRKSDHKRHYLVKCLVCGHEKEVSDTNFLKQSKAHSKLNCKEDFYNQYIGKQYGDYVIQSYIIDPKRGAICFCKCTICGNTKTIPFEVIMEEKKHSVQNCEQNYFNGYIGKQYGDYIITKYLGAEKVVHYFELQCMKCGQKIRKSLVFLRGVESGRFNPPQCEFDCVKAITDPHDKMVYNAIAVRYYNIVSRCNNPKDKNYNKYGARGIKVEYNNAYELYLDFKNGFKNCKTIEDINQLEFDRINNDDNYRKDNIRLANRHTQNINTRRKKTFLLKIGEDTILTNDVYFVADKYDYINPRALKNAINLGQTKYKDIKILKVCEDYLTIEEAEQVFDLESVTTKFLV